MNFKKSVAILGVTALAGTGTLAALPQAQAKSASQSGGVQLAACNPCNPCNPCGAKKVNANPCAAHNPCNPCAAKNPCNPCAAANPCNPCAAKKN